MDFQKLSDSHVCDAELLIDRNKLLDRLPKNATVAELGVDTGGFSKRIYSITNPEKLYLVDPWGSERYGEEKLNSVIKSFSEEVEKEEVIILRERSETALKQFDDQFFDWVYIDTTHTYNQTKLELELSEKKVKDSGIIAGHDYKIGNVDKGRRYGVIEAVHEFCEKKYNWKILYLTLETGGSRSFALTKIK